MRSAGYRCFGDISVIKALIEAQIAEESWILSYFLRKMVAVPY